MRFLLAFITIYGGKLLAQDTIYYDKLYARNVGESIEFEYKSRTTGQMEKDKLPTGKWLSLDSNDNILVETNFVVNKRKKKTLKVGLQLFRDPITGDTLLMREYNKAGVLTQQLGLQPAILVVENSILHIYKDFGSYTIAEYRKIYSGANDFTTIWKSSLEDPTAIFGDSNYLNFEKRIGDSTLLMPASFSTKAEYNYISNPEFEKHPSAYFSIMSFEDQVSDWSVASISPDFYLSKVGALSGNSYIGIRVFSLRKDIEYIQNKLRQPLVKDSIYCFSAYLKLSPGSRYATNAFGFLITQEKTYIDTDELLDIKPSKNLNTQILNYKTQWMKVQCTYKAKGGEQYITLGSFQNHKELELVEVPGTSPESYYYIDDVSLVPIAREEDCACNFADYRKPPPPPPVSTATSDSLATSTYEQLQVGDTLILDNIHFDNDESKLLAASFSTLYELLVFLHKNNRVHIKISGHTSSVGGHRHNVVLSERRAAAVKRFLTNNGIETERIETEGFGPDYPIASNDTQEGQKENRRVEFTILKK